LEPDKGNGVVVLDGTAYDRGILKIINDTSKFKPLGNDPTLNQEGKLQRFLRDLKKKGHLDQELYDAIYPSGSQAASFSERKHSDTIMSAACRGPSVRILRFKFHQLNLTGSRKL